MLVKVLVVSMVYGRASQHQRVRVGPAAAVAVHTGLGGGGRMR